MKRRRAKGRNIHGILLLDKAPGLSSNDALQQVKHLYKASKAGHTGSLDKLATGLLPICFGEATKISAYLLDADKHYEAVFHLGVTTNTGDAEGEILKQRSTLGVERKHIEKVIQDFLGPQMQIPPMHSALKRNGQPLYKLARQGITVEREAREITIHSMRLLDLQEHLARVQVHCSKGTYIRTLAEDIGETLGCGAHVSELRRTGVGPYFDMLPFTQLQSEAKHGFDTLDKLLLPPSSVVASWPGVELSNDMVFYVKQGQAVQVSSAPSHGLVRLVARADGKFLGVGEINEHGQVAPKRLLNC